MKKAILIFSALICVVTSAAEEPLRIAHVDRQTLSMIVFEDAEFRDEYRERNKEMNRWLDEIERTIQTKSYHLEEPDLTYAGRARCEMEIAELKRQKQNLTEKFVSFSQALKTAHMESSIKTVGRAIAEVTAEKRLTLVFYTKDMAYISPDTEDISEAVAGRLGFSYNEEKHRAEKIRMEYFDSEYDLRLQEEPDCNRWPSVRRLQYSPDFIKGLLP